MAEEIEVAQRDLAFLRSLTQDRRPVLRPLGALMVIAGLIQGLSALRFWAVAQGWLGWPEALRPLMGIDGVLLQVVAMFLIARMRPAAMQLPKGSVSPAARAIRGAANALAWALGTSALGLAVVRLVAGSGELLTTVFLIVLFAMIGAMWQVVFAVYRSACAFWAAIASSITAVVTGLAVGEAASPALVAAGFLLCLTAPGFVLMRQTEAE